MGDQHTEAGKQIQAVGGTGLHTRLNEAPNNRLRQLLGTRHRGLLRGPTAGGNVGFGSRSARIIRPDSTTPSPPKD